MLVVGESTSIGSGSGQREAFRWTEEGGMEALGFLAGGSNSSRANAISGDGLVIVGASSSAASLSGSVEAFRWQEDSMVALGDLTGGSFMSEALATDETGDVIVGVSSSDVGNEAFIWDAANGMRPLKAVLEAAGLDLSDWNLVRATGISGNGLRIVGGGVNPSGDDEGWIAILPEPTSTTLGLAAVLTLAIAAGQRRHRPSPASDR
jgi:probable HAF family extracellular repeat protein